MVCAQQPKPGTSKPKLKARFPTGFCYLALTLAELAPFWIAREHTAATRPPDAAASLLNLIAVHYALRPADEDHRYGHGKAEALAGLGQALFIGASAILVGSHAIDRLLNPEPIGAPALGIAVMLLSLAITIALLMFQNHVVKLTGSTAIRADSLHYRSDLLLNSSILLALLLASYGWPQLDAIFREAATVLMDQELDPQISAQMHSLACAVPGVLGVHDLRTRLSGTHWFVQLHVELPGELSLQHAHGLCDQVEAAIRSEFPRAEVLVHADPSNAAPPATAS